jgi:hypothetical protein
MSSQFDVNVKNNTGRDIYAVSVAHYCNDNTTAKTLEQVSSNQLVKVTQVTSYTGYKDYYGVQFVMGGDFFQLNCYCISDDDDTAVTIVLGASSYTIQYSNGGANTEACMDKSYDYTTE